MGTVLGCFGSVWSEAGLAALYWPEAGFPIHPLPETRAERLREELDGYLSGRSRRFLTPLAPAGTEFQRRTWAALGRIPYGETRSYGEIARALGMAGAARAVGAANGANPIAILIPCHRLVGGDGRLHGYGGGLAMKRRLLRLESQPG